MQFGPQTKCLTHNNVLKQLSKTSTSQIVLVWFPDRRRFWCWGSAEKLWKTLLFCFQVQRSDAWSGLGNNWGFCFADLCSSNSCSAEVAWSEDPAEGQRLCAVGGTFCKDREGKRQKWHGDRNLVGSTEVFKWGFSRFFYVIRNISSAFAMRSAFLTSEKMTSRYSKNKMAWTFELQHFFTFLSFFSVIPKPSNKMFQIS